MRVGLEKYFKWVDIEEYLNTRLMSIGSSIEKMREEKGVVIQNGKPYFADYGDNSPFPTPSEKIEFFADDLTLSGFDPLPVYEADRRAARRLLPAALRTPSGPHLCQDPEHATAQRVKP